MARQKRTPGARRAAAGPIDRKLEVIGDVRTAPITIREQGRPPFRPEMALWVEADTGAIWGSAIGETGQRAATLVEALRSPGPPPFGPRSALPARLLVFDEALATELRTTLADDRQHVEVVAPFAEFDALFAQFFSFLEEQDRPTSGLPDDVLTLLCHACARLWRHKPWQYMDDEPAVEIHPQAPGYTASIACVLGAIDEVYGVAFYASYDDYRRFVAAGEQAMEVWTRDSAPVPDAADAERAAQLMQALEGRSVLISFDPKAEIEADYREQLARNGWSRRQTVVPTFSALGGGEMPGEPTADEARQAALAIEALVSFCEPHEDEIALADFPLKGTVEVEFEGHNVPVAVSIPPEPAGRSRRSRAGPRRRRG